MTVEDTVQMMGVLESLDDGTPRSNERIKRLYMTLIEAPDRFWDQFWDEFTADSPLRAEILRKGVNGL